MTATIPSTGVPTAVADLLDLIAGDPLHERDREAVVTAIRDSVTDGFVDPNVVRELIPTWVYPRVVGAVYHSLAAAGVIAPHDWVISTDRRGKNSGRPARRYRWIGVAA